MQQNLSSRLIIFAAAGLISFGPIRAFAEPLDAIPTIEVTGEGEKKIEPDHVILQFGIQAQNKDLSVAKNEMVGKTDRLLKALKDNKVSNKNIQTSNLQIQPRYEYRNGKQLFVDYTAYKNFTVKIENLNSYGDVLNAVLSAGVENVSGVQYETSKRDELREEARTLALQDALKKAEKMAAQYGQKVGSPLYIKEMEEGGYAPPRAYMAKTMAMDAAPTDTLAPGEITVPSRVLVRFRLVSAK